MFKDDFAWGVATSSYQIEGAFDEDGKGLSVWDVFTEEGKCFGRHTGEVACDHYHRFKEDIKLMKELGVKAYRFSLSWPRILPDGVGKVNQKGIDFYNELIDCLLENGIEPYITLFHWDYPYELEKKGNWSNPDSPKWFLEYAEVVFKEFADRVKHFITFNEPQCFIGLAYDKGEHAPGLKCLKRDLVLKMHNVMLAHGLTVKAFRKLVPDGKIGYAPCGDVAMPLTDSKEDIEAARKRYFDVTANNLTGNVAWWSDPIMLGTYPEDTEAFRLYGKYLPKSYKEDLKIISEPIDFYCQNIYTGSRVRAAGDGYEYVKHSVDMPYTAIGWAITPKNLYWGPKFLYERYKKPIIISENGIACNDFIALDGKVHDQSRSDFIGLHLNELETAIDEGIDVAGYMYWSFMDNFEWAYGYSKRFGLVYVNYETMERIPKDSFYWYQNLIKNNGRNLSESFK
ncbi:MAG: beta-glucosidase [Ruminococcaceae bacterium]|nr:beta-glucosidase [Oscillospiraceae bacterium]